MVDFSSAPPIAYIWDLVSSYPLWILRKRVQHTILNMIANIKCKLNQKHLEFTKNIPQNG
jgi:hypothetical protein